MLKSPEIHDAPNSDPVDGELDRGAARRYKQKLSSQANFRRPSMRRTLGVSALFYVFPLVAAAQLNPAALESGAGQPGADPTAVELAASE